MYDVLISQFQFLISILFIFMSIQLIIGLGNYKGPYHHTPHNIGYHTVEVMAAQRNLTWKSEKGYCVSASFASKSFLIKPESYMNLSGAAVRWACDYWKIPCSDILVICDDFALPWEQLRFRRSGSSGGHNGLESVIASLGTTEFPRLRIGVGPVPERMDPKDYVLKRQPEEKINTLAEKASEAVEMVIQEGLEKAMNKFNAKAPKE